MRPHDVGLLFEECAQRGHRTAVVLDRPLDIAPELGAHLTVPELADLVAEASGWLAAAGARPGDRVAIVKRNHWDYDLLACAAVRIGAIPAQLSGHLSDEVLEILLKRLDPAVLVTDRALPGSGARTVLALAEDVDGALTLDQVRGSARPAPRRRHDDEPLVVNHTSGTTGVPKLVAHSTRSAVLLLARKESVRWPVIGLRPDDVLANASSYAHARTFRWTASALASAPAQITVLSDPSSAPRVLSAHPPTVVEALPSAYARWQTVVGVPDNPFRRVRLYASGHDAVHPPTVRRMLNASRHEHPVWVQGWGQTETGPLTLRFLTRRAVTGPRPSTRHLGRPLPGGAKLRVVDPETFEPLPRGRVGLLLARTPALGSGYLGEEERWRAKEVDGWWNTGDLGSISRTGAVRLLDREVDSAPGVSCLNVEDLVENRLPEVVECVLLTPTGRPPLPVLVTSDGLIGERRWRTAVADLPVMAAPVVLGWDEVPRTGTGKVRRLELLARLDGRVEPDARGRWT
ncbi:MULTISPECIES: class I adenylate-forming enzyme family protein [Actinosynnema]|uniref:class I adenylate-forming enzyme family protein n=1 Tax=Actinosynnema TaxID=40566 RepID=UPI0020A484E0|nr:class I adenylate-forming enzyme family protein [Actinosynnema pretiosum]MCP2098157.1 Acyl-CoA synthetase (AMP-forming)/AMP-acid ligase II [Actinosynnema pretiosum]